MGSPALYTSILLFHYMMILTSASFSVLELEFGEKKCDQQNETVL